MTKKIDNIIDTIEKWLFVILMMTMTIVVTLQVIFRYVIHSSLPWSEELSRYCMVFVTFIGVSAGLRVGTHTCVDFVLQILPKKAKFWAQALSYFVTIVLCIAFAYVGVQFTMQMADLGQKTACLKLPTWIPYGIIPVGFTFGAIREVENLIDHFKNNKNSNEVEVIADIKGE